MSSLNTHMDDVDGDEQGWRGGLPGEVFGDVGGAHGSWWRCVCKFDILHNLKSHVRHDVLCNKLAQCLISKIVQSSFNRVQIEW